MDINQSSTNSCILILKYPRFKHETVCLTAEAWPKLGHATGRWSYLRQQIRMSKKEKNQGSVTNLPKSRRNSQVCQCCRGQIWSHRGWVYQVFADKDIELWSICCCVSPVGFFIYIMTQSIISFMIIWVWIFWCIHT